MNGFFGKYWLSFAVLLLCSATVCYGIIAWRFDLIKELEDIAGTYAILSTLFGGLGFIALIATLVLQNSTLTEQRAQSLAVANASQRNQMILASQAELTALTSLLHTELEIAKMSYPNRPLNIDALSNKDYIYDVKSRIHKIIQLLQNEQYE